jgi:L-ascorbate metabolism protein UlaG (beta-lactamase superfamily)
VDAVLISHLHQDHLDRPSLSRVGRDVRVLVPHGAGPLLRRWGFRRVVELRPGDETPVGGVRIVATHAEHSGFRPPFGPRAACLGYIVAGSRRVYFAGDTDLFDGMARLGPIDVALVPVWGWGPTLGPGHLDPERAARALSLIRPAVAVPIHWGTLHPIMLRGRMGDRLHAPPREFKAAAGVIAPAVDVRILEPGEVIAYHEGRWWP